MSEFPEIFKVKVLKIIPIHIDALSPGLTARFSWPGNVRELQHALHRAVIMSDRSKLHTTDFQLSGSDGGSEKKVDDYNLNKLEKWAIGNCLKKHTGNVTKAAAELGLTRGALYRRIEKYGI